MTIIISDTPRISEKLVSFLSSLISANILNPTLVAEVADSKFLAQLNILRNPEMFEKKFIKYKTSQM